MTIYPHKQSRSYGVKLVLDAEQDLMDLEQPHKLSFYYMRENMIDNLIDRLYPAKYNMNEMNAMMHRFYQATRDMTKDAMRQSMLSYNKFIRHENAKWNTGLRTGPAVAHYRAVTNQPQHPKEAA